MGCCDHLITYTVLVLVKSTVFIIAPTYVSIWIVLTWNYIETSIIVELLIDGVKRNYSLTALFY